MGKKATAEVETTTEDTPSVTDQIMDGIDAIQEASDGDELALAVGDGSDESGDEARAGEGAGDGAVAAEGAGDDAAGAKDEPAGEDDKPATAEQEGKTDESGTGEEGKAAGDEGGEDKAGETDYEVPEGLSERATERFQSMVSDLKEKDEVITQQTEILTGMQEMIRDTGMDGQELAQVMDLAKVIKTDPKAAVGRLTEYVNTLAVQAGVKPDYGEVDLLKDFPDLRTRVEDMEITEEMALELAGARRQAEATAQNRQAEEVEQQGLTERNKGLTAVAGFLKEAEKDLDWDTKAPHLNEAAKFAAQNLAPSKWLGYIKGEYERIGAIIKAAQPAPDPGKQPLGGGTQGGGRKVPKNIEDVVNSILD